MSEIKPALTPKEWAGLALSQIDLHSTVCELVSYRAASPGTADEGAAYRFAAAAAFLHDQPFGFTWGHITDLEVAISVLEDQDAMDPLVYKLRNIRDLIAALLPPRVS